MTEPTLFELPPTEERAPAPPTRPEEARVLKPNRQQLQWLPRDLDAVLAEDHPARAIWGMLEKLDLSAFYGAIKATLDRPGRPTTDPQVLLALWLLGTVEGVGSARKLTRLCGEHDAYRWLCGGVPINYHMVSDFRVAHQEALDELLTQIVASLTVAGAVTLERVAQDGMRVRASAGASSFRRKETLEAHLENARAQVERLAQEREHPDPGVNQRERAARSRAARERVEQALEYLSQAQAAKERQQRTLATVKRTKVTAPRTSTTDPEARVMKMPDGGFRPAYNVELATDQAKGVIVGVTVIREGTDAGQALPMQEQVVKRTGQHPGAYLMDGSFEANGPARPEDGSFAHQNQDTRRILPAWRNGVSRCTPRCGCPGTNRRRSVTSPVTAIVPRWCGGASAWPRRKPRPCTGNEAPPPNGPMPR